MKTKGEGQDSVAGLLLLFLALGLDGLNAYCTEIARHTFQPSGP